MERGKRPKLCMYTHINKHGPKKKKKVHFSAGTTLIKIFSWISAGISNSIPRLQLSILN